MAYSLLSNIDEQTLISLQEQAKDFASLKGILMRRADLPKGVAVPLPFCLVPTKFPAEWFSIACKLQHYMSLTLFKASLDREFLKECLANTIEADEFTRNVFRIYEAVENEKTDDEQLSLALIRSDYLLACDPYECITGIKQVESNVIAASFGGMAPKIRDLHEYTLTKLGMSDSSDKLPLNNCCHEFAKGLVAAWEAYGNKSAVILFVIEELTTNIYDQRALEYAIFNINSSIKIVRHTFCELGSITNLKNKILFIKDRLEVAVVYYRTGYVPEQYEPEDWKTRLLMERSKAIKCPSAGMHLAGTKRVQLQLGKPGVLEKFVSPDIAQNLRKVFVNQYSLEKNEEGDHAISLGIKNPEKYVLKPEREGGGNNVYGTDIRHKLESIISSDERKAYILMERIHPPGIPNCIVLNDSKPVIENVTPELGIYGVILGNQSGITVNNLAGHVLRSKQSASNETGIVAGFGALDSPYLDI